MPHSNSQVRVLLSCVNRGPSVKTPGLLKWDLVTLDMKINSSTCSMLDLLSQGTTTGPENLPPPRLAVARLPMTINHLVGLVVKVSASRAEDPDFESHLRQDFSVSSHTSDLKIGTPVATLPGAWHYRVSAGTGRPGVSILWLGEVERLICNFYLSVAARKIVWADPSLGYTSMLLGR